MYMHTYTYIHIHIHIHIYIYAYRYTYIHAHGDDFNRNICSNDKCIFVVFYAIYILHGCVSELIMSIIYRLSIVVVTESLVVKCKELRESDDVVSKTAEQIKGSIDCKL